MLRITVLEEASEIRFVIEGKLVGPWVEELRKCWETSEIIQERRAVVDLAGVTQVDLHGKALLTEMHLQGTQLRASGVMTRAIVEGIRRVDSCF
jgi:ABC-type transporter Mla MlaB component